MRAQALQGIDCPSPPGACCVLDHCTCVHGLSACSVLSSVCHVSQPTHTRESARKASLTDWPLRIAASRLWTSSCSPPPRLFLTPQRFRSPQRRLAILPPPPFTTPGRTQQFDDRSGPPCFLVVLALTAITIVSLVDLMVLLDMPRRPPEGSSDEPPAAAGAHVAATSGSTVSTVNNLVMASTAKQAAAAGGLK